MPIPGEINEEQRRAEEAAKKGEELAYLLAAQEELLAKKGGLPATPPGSPLFSVKKSSSLEDLHKDSLEARPEAKSANAPRRRSSLSGARDSEQLSEDLRNSASASGQWTPEYGSSSPAVARLKASGDKNTEHSR